MIMSFSVEICNFSDFFFTINQNIPFLYQIWF